MRSYRKKETKSDDATKLTINNIICKKIIKKNIFWKKICNYKKKFLILRMENYELATGFPMLETNCREKHFLNLILYVTDYWSHISDNRSCRGCVF